VNDRAFGLPAHNQAKHAKTRPKFSYGKVAAQLELRRTRLSQGNPQTYARLGRETALPNQLPSWPCSSSRGKLRTSVSPCCSGRKAWPVCPKFPRSDQSVDRAVSLGHVQPGRSLSSSVAIRSRPKRQRIEPRCFCPDAAVQFVSPDRIELVQLIVQPIAAIFGN